MKKKLIQWGLIIVLVSLTLYTIFRAKSFEHLDPKEQKPQPTASVPEPALKGALASILKTDMRLPTEAGKSVTAPPKETEKPKPTTSTSTEHFASF